MNLTYEPYLGKKVFPAITITIPISLNYPEIGNDEEKLISMLNDVGYRMRKLFGNGRADMIMKQIGNLKSHIPALQSAKSLLIYLSPEFSKMIPLPYLVSEKIIVDDSFEIRDLVYSCQKIQNYFLLMISKNQIKTMIGNNNSAYLGIKIPGMPNGIDDVVSQHSLPGKGYTDKKAYKEKNTLKYIHITDKIIEEHVINQTDYPIIVMGEKKIVADFRIESKHKERIIGYIEGNFEHSSIEDIKTQVEIVLNKHQAEKEKKYLQMLEEANNSQHCELGLQNVWRAAAEGKGRILFVEKDYRPNAMVTIDDFSIVPVQDVFGDTEDIQDAVDEIIESILKFHGEIIFMENGQLSDYDSIALITRY